MKDSTDVMIAIIKRIDWFETFHAMNYVIHISILPMSHGPEVMKSC